MKSLNSYQLKTLIKSSPLLMAKFLTGGKYLSAPHLKYLDKKLREVTAGTCKRLIVSMPPRHGKSEMISKHFPVYHLLNQPQHRIMLTSYQSTLSAEWSKKARDEFEFLGKQYFDMNLEFGSKRNDKWSIEGFGGGVEATGIRGGQTGKGANILIIDDPVKNDEEALSMTMRDKNWEWFRSTAYTRLEPDGAIIIIMTRWNYDDLIGRILKDTDEEWDIVDFPAIAENNDILGRKPGEALWNKRFPLERLQNIKKNVGSYWFNSLYQQKPSNSETQILKVGWWRYYKELPHLKFVFQSWDTAFKDKEKNDYSVCITWGLSDNNNLYVIDIFRQKIQFPDLLTMAKALADKYKPANILIEDKASGQSLIQVLERETKLPITPVSVSPDKVTRAHALAPLAESGSILLKEGADWLADFLLETKEFPFSAHDDQVDSATLIPTYYRQITTPIEVHNPSNKEIDISSRYFKDTRLWH